MPRGSDPRAGSEFDSDHEGPSAEDLGRFGGETIVCEGCGGEMYDEAPFCHRCGRAAGAETAKKGGGGALFAGVVVLLVVALAIWGAL